ncbi:MAG: endonuclease/exonuclease/phosphatase family protein [Verrucomicrobiota bacterium]
MLKPIIVAVGLLTGVACAAEPVALRVLTYNLRYINPGDTGDRAWTARRDFVGAMVVSDHPDIIGVQEAFRPMLDDLAQRAPGYVEIGGGREDGLAKGEYSAILVKADRFTVQASGTFWLSDNPETVGSSTWGNEVVRICTWAKLYDRRSRQAFHYFNTHLDHRTPLARQKGTELILARMAAMGAGGPFVLTGDMNATPDDSLHALIQAEPNNLVDVWATLHPSAAPGESGTAHGFTGKTDSGRIDYIYASKSFGLVDSEILHDHRSGIYPSDHFPVRATLTFPAIETRTSP